MFDFIRNTKGTNMDILMRTTMTLMHFGIDPETIAETLGRQVDETVGGEHADEPCCEAMYDACEQAILALAMTMVSADN